MQTLWNRVAQSKCCCRCPQCLSSAKAVSRRAAASAPRRIPRFFTTSTFAYSSIFAAAATFDAGIKKDRREQWERAIEGVKQELEREMQPVVRLEEDESRTELEEEEEEAIEMEGEENATISYQPFAPESHEDAFRNVDPRNPRAHWPTNTGPRLEAYNLPPQSIYVADEVFRDKWRSNRWTAKKLALSQLAMDQLQLETFVQLQDKGWSDEAAQAVPADYAWHLSRSKEDLTLALISVRQLAQAIAKADLTSASEEEFQEVRETVGWEGICNFAQDAQGRFPQQAQGLNLTLIDLFRDHNKAKTLSTPALLAKLMHSISECRAPPDVNVYNALLQGLSEADQPQLVSGVIAAVRRSNTRPNEVTLAAILKHFTRTNEADKFIRWVEILRGAHGGLSLARPGINISDVSGGRLKRHPDNPEKVIQNPYPTPMVFGALIGGIVKFADFDAALRVCDALGSEGWGLCMGGFTPLLGDCADRGDWTRGLRIWGRIQALKVRSRRQTRGSRISEKIGLNAFAAMLRLCMACKEKGVYDEVFDMASAAHPDDMPKLIDTVKQQKKSALLARLRTKRKNDEMQEQASTLTGDPRSDDSVVTSEEVVVPTCDDIVAAEDTYISHGEPLRAAA